MRKIIKNVYIKNINFPKGSYKKKSFVSFNRLHDSENRVNWAFVACKL